MHIKAIFIAAGLFIVLSIIAVLVFDYVMSYYITGKEIVVVPNVTGYNIEYARLMADNESLDILVIDYEHNELPEGTILSQSPSKGRSIYKGRSIEVVVSGGTKQVSVPAMTGFSFANLPEVFEMYDLKMGEVRQRYSDDIPAGFVISTSPTAGATIFAGQPINIVISIGKDPLGQ